MSEGVVLLTRLHTAISLIGIGSGLVVVWGLFRGQPLPRWTAVFLTTTIATSVTGYFFPFRDLLPSHIVGAVSLAVLAVVLWARYGRGAQGRWGQVYVVGAVLALWLNVFVLVAQLFNKVPALHELAPTQTEPPFGVAELVVFGIFVLIGVRALRSTRHTTARQAI